MAARASWKGEGKKRNQSIEWYCERYGVNIEEYRKWFQGINHSVKEIQAVGRPGQTEAPQAGCSSGSSLSEETHQRCLNAGGVEGIVRGIDG